MSQTKKLTKVVAGCYEYRGVTGMVFTIDRDYGDDGKLRWYVREGKFPGGAPFDTYPTLKAAIAGFLPSQEMQTV